MNKEHIGSIFCEVVNGKDRYKADYLLYDGKINRIVFKMSILDCVDGKKYQPVKYDNTGRPYPYTWEEWHRERVIVPATPTAPSTLMSISGNYHELSAIQQDLTDRKVSAAVLDEAIETLKELKGKRGDGEYRDLIRGFSTLMDLHRRIEGKDKVQNNVQVNISLADVVKRVSEQQVKEIDVTEVKE